MVKPYKPNDGWAEQAKKTGYRARSVFKLKTLDKKYHLLRPGIKVLDLGAAPGSWLQYIAQKIGSTGLALGLDLREIEPIGANVLTRIADIADLEKVAQSLAELGWDKVDLLVSDIMANTTGMKAVDAGKSLELDRLVFALAKKYLKPKGFLVMKIFEGEDSQVFLAELKNYFSAVHKEKVQVSRNRSREVYLVCSKY